jgi:succinate dehydrogenase / fumarate reductase membrane anchor subunit
MNRRAQGLRAWLWQRLSAVFMLLYIVYIGVHLVLNPAPSYGEWRDWMAAPPVALATALFFGALLIHAWVGMRDVIIDYVGALSARLTLLTLTGLGLVAAGLWVLQALYSLNR